MKMRLLLAAFLSLLLSPVGLKADIQLPSLISDNMVLQRNGARLWGKGEPGEKVVVRFAEKKFSTEADGEGNWSVRISPAVFESIKPGGNYELTISGNNTVTIRNVAVGEVWVCAGQSNMEWSVANSKDATEELASARHPSIRFFTVAHNAEANEPQRDCIGKWVVCSPETAGPFSAVGYYFARELNGKLKVPVGIIHSAWGGTPAEAWTPYPALQADAVFKPVLDSWRKAEEAYPGLKEAHEQALVAWRVACDEAKAADKPFPPAPRSPRGAKDSEVRPGALYNGMIAPLASFSIKGVLWYQGESNASAPGLYRNLFPTLIAGWREAWGNPNLPFYYVQLPNFMAKRAEPSNSNWALLREAQAQALQLKNTGMVVSIDLGEEKSIHPKNKQDVARRLAAIALGRNYNMDRVVYSGPLFSSIQVEGERIRVNFAQAEPGLVAKNGAPLRGFAIAGEDKVFHWAEAQIKGQSVIVSSPEVPKPVAVRYAWADNPDADLANKAGLPAAPFRTDAWE